MLINTYSIFGFIDKLINFRTDTRLHEDDRVIKPLMFKHLSFPTPIGNPF